LSYFWLVLHEQVVVVNHERPTFVIVHPDDAAPSPAAVRRGRPLREALTLLAAAALPDPGFADDMEAVLADVGQDTGAHDRVVAATAIAAGWRVGTANLRHFDRIAGLDVLAVSFTRLAASASLAAIGLLTPAPLPRSLSGLGGTLCVCRRTWRGISRWGAW
jgi:hypothetical protein